MIKIISILVLNKSDEILLLKRSPNRKSYPSKWNFISGTIENESSIQCANRELREELGEIANFELLRKGKPFIDNEKEGKWKVHTFLYRYISGDIILNNEHTEYKWISKNKLNSYDIVPGIIKDLKHVDL